jgi:hypothetical protein
MLWGVPVKLLLSLTAGLASGNPSYEQMSPAFAQVTRQELADLQGSLARLGQVQSVAFKGVGPAGGDIYEVIFERGTREFRILFESDGHVQQFSFLPRGAARALGTNRARDALCRLQVENHWRFPASRSDFSGTSPHQSGRFARELD